MRLVRFLAAGKSLVGLKDLEGRYRLPNGRALPRFGTSKDATTPAIVESVPQSLPGAPEVPAAPANIAPKVIQGLGETITGQEPKLSQPQPGPHSESVRRENSSIFRKLFGWLPWYSKTPTTGVIPAFSRLPVQTELSLENVKVVRNDLSESDLEVQAARNKQEVSSAVKPQIGEPMRVSMTPSNPSQAVSKSGGD